MEAGKILKAKNYTFDLAITSVLLRAHQTLKHITDELQLNDMPVIKSWRLNERHYGALQGLNKAETAKIHGNNILLCVLYFCFCGRKVLNKLLRIKLSYH